MPKIAGKKYYGGMKRKSNTSGLSDREYLRLFREGGNIEDHSHSKVKRFSKAEIENYLEQLKQK
jgi:hypothetical protein